MASFICWGIILYTGMLALSSLIDSPSPRRTSRGSSSRRNHYDNYL